MNGMAKKERTHSAAQAGILVFIATALASVAVGLTLCLSRILDIVL